MPRRSLLTVVFLLGLNTPILIFAEIVWRTGLKQHTIAAGPCWCFADVTDSCAFCPWWMWRFSQKMAGGVFVECGTVFEKQIKWSWRHEGSWTFAVSVVIACVHSAKARMRANSHHHHHHYMFSCRPHHGGYFTTISTVWRKKKKRKRKKPSTASFRVVSPWTPAVN